MQPSPDIRYVLDGTQELAVEFNGCYFIAYHVGSEDIGVNISMEMVVAAYPEVSQESLIRIGHYHSSVTSHGVWALDTVAADGMPPVPKGVVSDIDDPSGPSMLNLQQRLNDLRTENHDLIKTLEQSVEALDDIVAAPTKPSTWASALVPILEASAAQGIPMTDILKEAGRIVNRLEHKQNL